MQRQALLCVLLGAASALVALGRPGGSVHAEAVPAPPSPEFQSLAEVVRVDVSVVDAEGRPVRDLQAEDFSLEEDGVPQTIEAFHAVAPLELPTAEPWTRDRVSTNTPPVASSGRSFTLVFDDIHLSPRGAERARAIATDFIRGLGRGDRAGAVTASGRVWSTGRLPWDQGAVLSAIKRVEGMRPAETRDADQMSDYEAFQIAEHNDLAVLKTVEARLARDQQVGTQGLTPDLLGATYGSTGAPSAASSGGGRPPGDPNARAGAGSESSEKVMAQTLATQLNERAKERRGRVFQSITRVLGSLGLIEGRKAVILLSEGFLHDPGDRRFVEVSNACRRAGATIYVLDMGGLVSVSADAGQQHGNDTRRPVAEQAVVRTGLERLAGDSGGFAVTNTNDTARGLERVVEESAHFYLVGYRSSHGLPDGKYRRIRVSTSRAGVEVRARPGYFALPESASAAASAGPVEAGRRLREALDAPATVSGLPLRMSSFSFDRTRDGMTRTLLVSELRLDDVAFEEKEGRFTAELDVLLTVTDPATGRTLGDRSVPIEVATRSAVRGQNVWHRVTQEVGLSPGPWQARLVVRDRRSGLIGSVIHPLEVPGEMGFRVSSPVVSDAVAPDPKRDALHALPVARRTFLAAGQLYCEFQVYDKNLDRSTGVPRVSAGVSIVQEGGKSLRKGELSAIDPGPERRLERLVTVPLRGLGPGNYELVLQLKDDVTGETQDLREPFSLVRPDRPTAALYEDLLRDYLEGRGEEAVGALLAWRTLDVVELAKKVVAGPGPLARGTVMFHTEAALTLLANAQPTMATAHLDIARGIAERAERETPFRRDWLLAVAFQMQALSQGTNALVYFQECQTAFPAVADAWLGAGTVYEFSAFPDGLGGSQVDLRSASLVSEAERQYRQALTLDSSLVEARLHLGRVLQHQGRRDEARTELVKAAESPEGGPNAALALLFLGQMLEQEGHPSEAAERYRAALVKDPTLQQAGLALAGNLGLQGDRVAALEALGSVLNNGCSVGPPKWLLYHLGLGVRASAAIDSLRRAIHS
jgi:VWFA-related protein